MRGEEEGLDVSEDGKREVQACVEVHTIAGPVNRSS